MIENKTTRVVVIGGGAGGLELTVRLARKFKRDANIDVTLVDRNPTHIWKPLLHEIATGSLNGHHDETSYLALAKKHRFSFVLGSVENVDTSAGKLQLSPILDENHQILVDRRLVEYDQLVLSVGSVCNDFGTPGVSQHSLLLDTRQQAERFHTQFLSHLHRLNAHKASPAEPANEPLSLVIVGAGATGVELAADLFSVAKQLPAYGFDALALDKMDVKLIEAGPRILAALPERISNSVSNELENIGVHILTNTPVTEVTSDSVKTASGQSLNAQLVVWAAGIQAPEFLAGSGFNVDKLGRVIVTTELKVPEFTNVFAIGDCCACPMKDGRTVPPRAQSAHQMAAVAYKNIVNQLAGKPLRQFEYHDLGSLISLSKFSTVGSLMGNLMRGSIFVEGWLARLFYLSLYRMHQMAIHGMFSTVLIMLNDKLYKATRADIKLH